MIKLYNNIKTKTRMFNSYNFKFMFSSYNFNIYIILVLTILYILIIIIKNKFSSYKIIKKNCNSNNKYIININKLYN